jgi:hypothetical protein
MPYDAESSSRGQTSEASNRSRLEIRDSPSNNVPHLGKERSELKIDFLTSAVDNVRISGTDQRNDSEGQLTFKAKGQPGIDQQHF